MRKRQNFMVAALLFSLLAGCGPTPAADPSPTPAPDPYANEYAEADVSRLEDGVVSVRYIGGAEVRVKVQITRAGGENYNYDLLNDGSWETFALTEGDGEYTLRVLENTTENRYKPVFDCLLTLALKDPAAPFRQASQYVDFEPDSPAADMAAQLVQGLATEEEQVAAVFRYVVENLTYDKEKAVTAETGYLPDVDAVLEKGSGICFDYAALMTAMLRSRGIACKLAVGWAGKEYHAWVEVLREDGTWERMDPTFVSNGREDEQVMEFVKEDENYRVRYYY